MTAQPRVRRYTPLPLPTGAFEPAAAPGALALTLLVAGRELRAILKSKVFRVTLAILVIMTFGGMALTSFLVGAAEEEGGSDAAGGAGAPGLTVAVAGTPDPALDPGLDAAPGLEPRPAPGAGAVRDAVRDGTADAGVLWSADGKDATIVVLDAAPEELVLALSREPGIEYLDPPKVSDMAQYFVSLAFGVVFFLMAALFGQLIAQNTVVEKQTRVVEILLAQVPARALLAGKILGTTVLAVGLTLILAGGLLGGLAASGRDQLLGVLTAPMWWYVAFFLVGFVMLAAMYAAAASLVSRMEDVGYVSMPVMMLVMAPYVLVLALNTVPSAMKVASFIPFSAPTAMPVRMVIGEVPAWEPLASLAILAVTALGAIALGGRMYEYSLLRTGPRIRMAEALRSER
jgi:ABC-2 type transport system permease protein